MIIADGDMEGLGDGTLADGEAEAEVLALVDVSELTDGNADALALREGDAETLRCGVIEGGGTCCDPQFHLANKIAQTVIRYADHREARRVPASQHCSTYFFPGSAFNDANTSGGESR
jgi:hypothetical protein